MSAARLAGGDREAQKQGLADRVRARARDARARWPTLDHAVRALDRNSEVLGFQEAAAITYFGFLAFFPLLAIGFALVGYLSAVYPGAEAAVTAAVRDAFPTLIGPGKDQISLEDVKEARARVGLLGLAGLLVAGLGWLNSLRNALRRVFATADVDIPFLKRKLLDAGVLVLLGVTLLVSIMVTTTATAATKFVLDLVGLEKTLVATVVVKVTSVALALAVDTVMFAVVFSRLSGAHLRWRQLRSGSFVGACGFELLKIVGTFLIGRTTGNPFYAAFGVVVGLLVWMNLVARVTVFAAAWTVTRPFSLEPGDLIEEAAGRSTPVAASTEPVSVVAPPDYEQVPVSRGWRRRAPAAPGRGWRAFAAGAAVGAGAAAVSARLRRGGCRDVQ